MYIISWTMDCVYINCLLKKKEMIIIVTSEKMIENCHNYLYKSIYK